MCSASAARFQRAKWEVDRAIHAAISKVESNPALQWELRRLLAHVRAHGELLRPLRNEGRAGWLAATGTLRALSALAEHHADWLREVESWRAPRVSPRDQFAALARYLLANQPVPAFMTNVWFVEPSAESRRHQRWFKHIGIVGTIRGADTPLRMNKRMAFLFATSPAHFSVQDALSRARNGLTVARQPIYPTARSRRRRKRDRYALLHRIDRRFPPTSLRGFSHVVHREQPWQDCQWTIRRLCSYRELREESAAMRHCVASYARWCMRGTSIIWSLRCYGPTGIERRLTIEVLPRSRLIYQALGFCNRRASREERQILQMWAEQEGFGVAKWI